MAKGIRGKPKKGRPKRKAPLWYDVEKAFREQAEKLNDWELLEMIRQRPKAIYEAKEIRAGEQLEVEIVPRFFTREDIPEEARKRTSRREAQRNLNEANAVKYLTRKINANFTDGDYWITVTYPKGQEPKDMAEADKRLNAWIGKINYRLKKAGAERCKYVAVTEHDEKAKIRWHHHVVMHCDMASDKVLQLWSTKSRNECKPLVGDEYSYTGMALYITKMKDTREKYEKKWKCSRNLKDPDEKVVISKKQSPDSRRYKPVESYVTEFVTGKRDIEEQMKAWYPGYLFTDYKVKYNNWNKRFYIYVRMRRKP